MRIVSAATIPGLGVHVTDSGSSGQAGRLQAGGAILAFLFAGLLAGSGLNIPGVLAGESPPPARADLGEIADQGVFRVLYYAQPQDKRAAPAVERELLEGFAKEFNMSLEWLAVPARWRLVPDLLAGRGDIVIGQGRSLAAGVMERVGFTLPWASSRLQIVMRSNTGRINTPRDLALRQIALKRSSAAWPILEELARQYPTMDLLSIPESVSQETILARVASGQYDVTVSDSDFLLRYLPKHPELSAAYDLTEGEPRAWAVRPEAKNLRAALNQFLYKNHLSLGTADVYFDDLPGLRERRTLRLITYRNPANYYVHDGRFQGFEYELINRFAERQGMRVDVVLAKSHAEMQELLVSGRGDVIAASLPAESIRGNRQVSHTVPYNFAAPVVIGRQSDKPILDIRGLEGRRITLPAESPYRPMLERLREHGVQFDIKEAVAGLDARPTLFMVAMGMYDLTVLGSHQLTADLADQFAIQGHFNLSEPVPHVWAVRAADTQMLAALNNFIKDQYRRDFYNVLYAKYFDRPSRAVMEKGLLEQVDRLSPYDEIVQRYAEQYGFDWRLIVALMYQESRFDPAAVSHAGAEGLMQMLPETADSLGTVNLADPENSIRAGVKYLSLLRDQFENELLLEDRVWLSVASYNAGFGRIRRARNLAVEMGFDGDRWFDNVERAMLAMARPSGKAGDVTGNCRCGETVAYVREIRTLYNNYVRLMQAAQIAGTGLRHTAPYDI